jgi:DNA polymerase I-like protein with 3'-5' exonuclease and polymerase domains
MRDERRDRKFSLIEALDWFGLPAVNASEKDAMRERIMLGGPFSTQECEAILDYCESDAAVLASLLEKIVNPSEDLRPRLYRGEFVKASAAVERNGVPFDMPLYRRLQQHRLRIKQGVAKRLNELIAFQLYRKSTFDFASFENFLRERGLLEEWPRTKKGRLATSAETFEKYAGYSELGAVLSARQHLLRLGTLTFPVGRDDRNRCHQGPFATTTGRNAPKASQSIFGAAKALRSLIKPERGHAIIRADWKSQEGVIAASLSNDRVMQEVFAAPDPYLAARNWLAQCRSMQQSPLIRSNVPASRPLCWAASTAAEPRLWRVRCACR